jgi:hypothetical protein
MISSEILAQENGFKATLYWEYEDGQKDVSCLRVGYEEAMTLINKATSKLISEKVQRYVQQRLWLYKNNHIQLTSISKANAIEKLDLLKSSIPNLSLLPLVKTIVANEKFLMEVMPGEKSKYYSHDWKVIPELIADCKRILNTNTI